MDEMDLPQASNMMEVAIVAQRLNCKRSTVYNLCKSGKLEYYRCPGIRVSEAQLRRYLKQTKCGRRVEPEKSPTPRPRLKHIRVN